MRVAALAFALAVAVPVAHAAVAPKAPAPVKAVGSVELADSIIELLAWCLRPRAFSDDKIVLLFSRSGSNG